MPGDDLVDLSSEARIVEELRDLAADIDAVGEPQSVIGEQLRPLLGGRREGGGVGARDQVGGRQEVGDDKRAAGLEVARDVVEQRLLVLDQARDLDAEDHVVAAGERIARAVAMMQADAIGEAEACHAARTHLNLTGRDRAAVQHEVRMSNSRSR